MSNNTSRKPKPGETFIFVSMPSGAKILLDFRRLVTRTGTSKFTTCFGPGWENDLAKASLGHQMTTFVAKLADVGGIEKVDVGPQGAEISYTPTANVFPRVSSALGQSIEGTVRIIFDPLLPVETPQEPPYAHLGI